MPFFADLKAFQIIAMKIEKLIFMQKIQTCNINTSATLQILAAKRSPSAPTYGTLRLLTKHLWILVQKRNIKCYSRMRTLTQFPFNLNIILYFFLISVSSPFPLHPLSYKKAVCPSARLPSITL